MATHHEPAAEALRSLGMEAWFLAAPRPIALPEEARHSFTNLSLLGGVSFASTKWDGLSSGRKIATHFDSVSRAIRTLSAHTVLTGWLGAIEYERTRAMGQDQFVLVIASVELEVIDTTKVVFE